MKKLSILLLAFVALTGFNACTSDDDVVFIAQPDPEGIAFTNTFSPEYILTNATAENTVERFVWNEIDLDVPTNINYDLMASASQDMSDPVLMGSTAGTNLAVKVKQLLSLAQDAGLDNDPETEAPNTGTLYFQVQATAGTAGELLHESDVQPLTVVIPETTGEGEIELPKIYMVGNFQSAGGYGNDWTPADGVPLTASGEGNTDFEGYVYINVDSPEFKFLPTNEGWDGDYGDAGTEAGVYTGSLLQEGEVNAGTPDGTGGYYLVKVNTETLTYTLEKYSWGVIGNATPTGWDSDTDMSYDTDNHVWTVTMDLTAQDAPDNGFKFRANDSWDVNLGDTGADGTLEPGGENIGVPEAGNYTITLDLNDSRNPTYTLTKN
ncbi:SusF/SusE family outer membrane protein [Salinimicrobium catena]|uniref:SusF/SusE family outer membrane protein n=1 Tax=Salinimicrobium catena TaxID=390640 RepID=UPI002FE4F3AD